MKGIRDMNNRKIWTIQVSGVTEKPWLLLNTKFVSSNSKAIMEKLYKY
jgi:hypothetical protein